MSIKGLKRATGYSFITLRNVGKIVHDDVVLFLTKIHGAFGNVPPVPPLDKPLSYLVYFRNVKERIVLREIHLRTTGRHLSMGSHSVICHPTEVTAPAFTPTGQVGTRFIDPVKMKG